MMPDHDSALAEQLTMLLRAHINAALSKVNHETVPASAHTQLTTDILAACTIQAAIITTIETYCTSIGVVFKPTDEYGQYEIVIPATLQNNHAWVVNAIHNHLNEFVHGMSNELQRFGTRIVNTLKIQT